KSGRGAISSGMRVHTWPRLCATLSMASWRACSNWGELSPPSSTRCPSGFSRATASHPQLASPAVPWAPRTPTSGPLIAESRTYPHLLSCYGNCCTHTLGNEVSHQPADRGIISQRGNDALLAIPLPSGSVEQRMGANQGQQHTEVAAHPGGHWLYAIGKR